MVTMTLTLTSLYIRLAAVVVQGGRKLIGLRRTKRHTFQRSPDRAMSTAMNLTKPEIERYNAFKKTQSGASAEVTQPAEDGSKSSAS